MKKRPLRQITDYRIHPKDREIMDAYLAPILDHALVQSMRGFRHHGRLSTYDHAVLVTSLSCRLNRRLRLHADEKALVTGAFLHDFFLYDWFETTGEQHLMHGFRHAALACENAVRYFDVGEKVQHIIRTHMWPLNLTKLPRSREAWIVTIADKCSAVREAFM